MSEIHPTMMNRRRFGKMSAWSGLSAATAPITGLGADKAGSPVQLRVLCYNIHFGQGNDGVYDIPRIAEAIRKTQPDLVALQEIDVHVERSGRLHELRMLAEETGMAGHFGPTQHYQGGLYGNGILSRLPVHEVHIQPLPYTEATPELLTYPRAAVAAVVGMPGGKKMRFISTHFQHAQFEDDRLAEAVAINGHFAADDPSTDAMGPEAASLPTILAGDFNAVLGSLPVDELQKKWAFIAEDEPVPTSPTKAPAKRIDFILHRRSDAIRALEHRVIDERMASDHFPVFAVLEVR